MNKFYHAICSSRRIRLVTIVRKILDLQVVTKESSWEDPPSLKREIVHVVFITRHKNN